MLVLLSLYLCCNAFPIIFTCPIATPALALRKAIGHSYVQSPTGDVIRISKGEGEVRAHTHRFRCLFLQTAQTAGLLQWGSPETTQKNELKNSIKFLKIDTLSGDCFKNNSMWWNIFKNTDILNECNQCTNQSPHSCRTHSTNLHFIITDVNATVT